MRQHHETGSVLYIAAVGVSASTHPQYWTEARKRFNYAESIAICGGKQIAEKAESFFDPNTNIIIVNDPFYGTTGYTGTVMEAVKSAVNLKKDYQKHGLDIDEIVVNTSGGTEKVSLIVRDTAEILKQIFGRVTHVWGASDYGNVRYTEKPDLNFQEIAKQFK